MPASLAVKTPSPPSLAACRVLFAWPGVPDAELFNFLPLGIGYLAANLENRHPRQFFDGVLAAPDGPGIRETTADFAPDLVAISVWSFNFRQARELAAAVREVRPQCRIVVGGPEPSGRGAAMLADFPEADYAQVGEGEKALAQLTDLLARDQATPDALAQVPGLVFRDGDTVRANAPLYPDLAEVAGCDYAFIRFDAYLARGYTYGMHRHNPRTAPLLTSRGCPYTCSFCSARRINGRRVRLRPVDAILNEIRHLHAVYGVTAFNIIDDNFTFHVDFAKAVCRGILDLGLPPLSFNCPNGVRMERLDAQLLALMRRAGWEWVFIAPESGSPATLARMRKSLRPDTVVDKVRLIHAAGLYVFGFFIIGYPGETEADIRMTLVFAHAAGFDAAVFTCFHPLPGTPIYKEMEASGELAGQPASRDYYTVTYAPAGLTPGRLQLLRLAGIVGFHLRSPRRVVLALRYKSVATIWTFLKKLVFSRTKRHQP